MKFQFIVLHMDSFFVRLLAINASNNKTMQNFNWNSQLASILVILMKINFQATENEKSQFVVKYKISDEMNKSIVATQI